MKKLFILLVLVCGISVFSSCEKDLTGERVPVYFDTSIKDETGQVIKETYRKQYVDTAGYNYVEDSVVLSGDAHSYSFDITTNATWTCAKAKPVEQKGSITFFTINRQFGGGDGNTSVDIAAFTKVSADKRPYRRIYFTLTPGDSSVVNKVVFYQTLKAN